MRIGSVTPSNPRKHSVGRATSNTEADIRSYAVTRRPARETYGGRLDQQMVQYSGGRAVHEVVELSPQHDDHAIGLGNGLLSVGNDNAGDPHRSNGRIDGLLMLDI